ncbi:hypothetical protein B4135_2320 [Caldibacillus debilis]|uniref:Uncharacterized protein n=1 Tax=Caldibacillus debilis TaxID=301148 RepID=A0A150M385_9BACI|nr:hypothetical protein B4135_2320 [Caldibacillus debilis]
MSSFSWRTMKQCSKKRVAAGTAVFLRLMKFMLSSGRLIQPFAG